MTTPAQPTRAEWLAARKHRLGASQVASALGANPYQSRFQLWAEYTGLIDAENLDDVERVQWGLDLEPVVINRFGIRSGRTVNAWPQYESVPSSLAPWLWCTPDAVQECPERGPGTVQIKTTSAWLSKEWAEQPPLHVQIQANFEAAIMGYEWGTAVALIGGQKLVWHDFERNDRFVEAAMPKLEEFWRLVQDRIPPEPDGSESTARVLARLYPQDTGETVHLPPEAREWAEQLETAKQTIKDAEKVKDEADNKLRAAIGAATVGLLPNGEMYTLKTQHRKEYVCKASTFRVLRRAT